MMVSSDFQAKVDYDKLFGKHMVKSALIYQMQSLTQQGRNNSRKNLSFIANATYIYDSKYIFNAVFNRSGSAYLPDGEICKLSCSFSSVVIIERIIYGEYSTLGFLKLRVSYGLSGWDGNLSHELWRQAYGGSGTNYCFGKNASEVWGGAEGDLPVVGLVAEKSEKATLGLDFEMFDGRLNGSVEGFYEKRSDMLVPDLTQLLVLLVLE